MALQSPDQISFTVTVVSKCTIADNASTIASKLAACSTLYSFEESFEAYGTFQTVFKNDGTVSCPNPTFTGQQDISISMTDIDGNSCSSDQVEVFDLGCDSCDYGDDMTSII